MSTPFVQVGGIRLGESLWEWSASVPFALITVSRESIEVRLKSPFSPIRTYAFTPESIRRLRAKFGWFRAGLYIESTVADYPPCIVYLSTGMKSLVAALQEHGFQVEGV